MKRRSPKSQAHDVEVGPPGRRDVPSTKFGQAIGDVMVREEWTSVGTLELWVGGDRVSGTVALLDPMRARKLSETLAVWSRQAIEDAIVESGRADVAAIKKKQRSKK